MKRGEYLTHAADCQACHTAQGGAPFAGGLAFNMPFGTIYSTNITPDKQTGIGNYTDAQFLAAVHRGIRADGEKLYPAMPYASYSAMTNDDVLAIKAYLFTLAPVHAAARENRLSWPYNQRGLLALWNVMFNPDERFRPNAGQSRSEIEAPIWPRRWAIAANAIRRATPPMALTITANSRAPSPRAGAPTTSPATRLPAWAIGATRISPSICPPDMPTAMAARRARWAKPPTTASVFWCRMTCMRWSPICAAFPPLQATCRAPSPRLRRPRTRRDWWRAPTLRGEKIFAGACASCHDWTGVSPVTGYATLTGVRAVNDPSATNVAQVVIHGVNRKTDRGKIFMPAFGAGYSDDDIAAVANYVTTRFGAKGADLTGKDVGDLRKQATQQPNSQEAPNG